MKKLIVFTLFLIIQLHATDGEKVKLKVKQPNWRLEKLQLFEDGSPASIVYYEPISEGKERAVKLLKYRFQGTLESESDLIDMVDGKPIFQGASISYFADGTVEKVLIYDHDGTLSTVKHYHPNGLVRYEYRIRNGAKEGRWFSYFNNGEIKEQGSYHQDQPEGEYQAFYSNRKKAAEAFYHKGLLQGKTHEWHENGSLKTTAFYLNGLLHHERNVVALRRYYEDGVLQEEQDFISGQPIGTHTRYHPNGQLEYRVTYNKGKKQGKECFFSAAGSEIGFVSYRAGIPVGQHVRKTAEGTILYSALYDQKGCLLEPICEFDATGRKVLQYVKVDELYENAFLEWYSSGSLKRTYNYKKGVLDGIQEDFYESGQSKLKVSYDAGKKEGNYQEWHANGQKKCSAFYEKGLLHGLMQEWYRDQKLKSSVEYVLGKKQGKQYEWNEKGTLVFEADYDKDTLNGEVKEWYPNGIIKSLFVYRQGKLDGIWRRWYENGKVQEERTYCLGIPQGVHRTFYPLEEGAKESILEKEWSYREGKLDGQQKRFYRDGSPEAVLSYNLGILHGRKTLWDSFGNVLEEATYVSGNLEGRYYRFTHTGQEIIYHYKDNRLNGLHQIYYPTDPILGRVKALEAEFIDGFLEGEVSEFNEVGVKIVSTFYVKGKKEGIATIYNREGKVRLTVPFKDDNQTGTSYEYSTNGKMIRAIDYLEDKREGEEKCFFEDGTLAVLKTFKNDLIDGVWREWNRKGLLIYDAEFKEGQRHGSIKKYDDDGRLFLLQTFEEDVLKEKQVL